MKNLGIDVGNQFTKTSTMDKFYSKVTSGNFDLNKEEMKIEYEGKHYTLGTGTATLGNNRYFTQTYDICLLSAIALSIKEDNIEVNIIVGMPPEQFESELKDKLTKKLNNMGVKTIKINGKTQTIKIPKASVFEESAIVFGSTAEYRDKRVIVIDIGGGTTDISQFNNLKLEKSTTTKYGMLSLYENMKKAINTKHTVKLISEDMIDLVNKDKTIIRGEEKDISFVKDIVLDHVSKIYNEIQNFDYDNAKVLIIGGGATPLGKHIQDQLTHAQILENSQFANALTYAKVGDMLYGIQGN